jgi:putative endonuclease
MYFAYVLKSERNHRLYYGSTNNLKRRLKEHNAGQSKYTRSTRPFKIVYFEEYRTLKEARKRELFYKSGKGREYIKKKLARAVA